MIKAGDTLQSIAVSHDTTQQAIADLNAWPNGLNQILVEGDIILVPRD